MARTTVFADATAGQENSVIIVSERTLVGPNSAAHLRGGRLFLPVAAIAQALGDSLSSDPTTRTVTVRRQNGTVAVFNAPLNEYAAYDRADLKRFLQIPCFFPIRS